MHAALNLCNSNDPSFDDVISIIIKSHIDILSDDLLSNTIKFGAALEQAHWDYEDNYADAYRSIKHMSFKKFIAHILPRCPGHIRGLYPRPHKLINRYYQYKKKIPVCGCIVLNKDMTRVILVTDFKNRHYTFPRGKIDPGESTYECALREVAEEIGQDMRPYTTIEDEIVKFSSGRNVTMYVALGVPEDIVFAPKTKKEIMDIRWYDINDLPHQTYDVNVFVEPLRRWISRRCRSMSIPDSSWRRVVRRHRTYSFRERNIKHLEPHDMAAVTMSTSLP